MSCTDSCIQECPMPWVQYQVTIRLQNRFLFCFQVERHTLVLLIFTSLYPSVTFSVIMTTYLTRRKLRGEGLWFGVIMSGKAWQQEAEKTGHTSSRVVKQRDDTDYQLAVSFSFFISCGDPSSLDVGTHMYGYLTSSASHLWKHSHRHTVYVSLPH